MSEKFNHDAYVSMLEEEYQREIQAQCDHPESEQEYGKPVFVNSFHGFDQRVYCRKCGFSRWD